MLENIEHGEGKVTLKYGNTALASSDKLFPGQDKTVDVKLAMEGAKGLLMLPKQMVDSGVASVIDGASQLGQPGTYTTDGVLDYLKATHEQVIRPDGESGPTTMLGNTLNGAISIVSGASVLSLLTMPVAGAAAQPIEGETKALITEEGVAGSTQISNPVPSRVARVIDEEFLGTETLARGSEAWVTAADDIKGISNSTDLAKRLTLTNENGRLLDDSKVILEFDTPSGIATPINRNNPGFVTPGTGKTAGGAREFVIPNQKLEELQNLTIKKVNKQ
ncbi:hypothetical protein EB093_09120 [bacterium]|nr:hypothetical protein [bacterium]